MLMPTPPLRKSHRAAKNPAMAAPPPPPLALVLVSAMIDPDGPIRYLTFDRAVDLSGVDSAAFEVKDGDNDSDFIGVGAPGQNDPTQCNVPMESAGPYSGTGVTATVGPGNGIVAADDGGLWAGAVGLVLPWP
jgi:hypothetical protein